MTMKRPAQRPQPPTEDPNPGKRFQIACLEDIRIGGVHYAEGEEYTVTEAQAGALMAAGRFKKAG